jgi:hypothetical protein
MDDVAAVTKIIKECTRLGVGFALDDFGTGYSSLTYFRRLPTQLLKIDRSFVQHMLDDSDDLAIVEGVVSLSHAFQRRVIAEGVESVEHGIPLLHYGCDLAQGFGIAPPMPAGDLPGWVGAWRRPPEWEAMSMVRWSKEDFPLLVAELHHRRWIERIADVVAGRAEERSLPPLGSHDCLFGRWLYREGRARYGSMTNFAAIEPAHERLHALGAELLALAGTRRDEATARLPELHAASEAMIRLLDEVKEHIMFAALDKGSGEA